MNTSTEARERSWPQPEAQEEPRHRSSGGRVSFGVLLILLGLAWLAERTELIRLRWQTVLSVTLLVVGAALLLTARGRHWDGLVPLGVILTLLLVFSSVAAVPLSPTAGERRFRPTTVAQLEERYELGAGPMILDLRDLDVPSGVTEVEASVGMGDLTVRLPEDAAADIEASSGAGEVRVLGRTSDGIGARLTDSVPGREGAGRLRVKLSVGLGAIEVTR